MKILFLGPQGSLCSWLQEQYEVFQTEEKITPEEAAGFDWLISYGYRHIIKKPVLDLFPKRAINLHISFLPWNRGADPNFWSWRDNTPKGVSIHFIDEGLDTGDILVQRIVHMDHDETLSSSYLKLKEDIEQLFKESWIWIINGWLQGFKQPPGGSFHWKRDKTWAGPWDTPVKQIGELT